MHVSAKLYVTCHNGELINLLVRVNWSVGILKSANRLAQVILSLLRNECACESIISSNSNFIYFYQSCHYYKKF